MIDVSLLKRKNMRPNIVASVIPEKNFTEQIRGISSKLEEFYCIPEFRMDMGIEKDREYVKKYMKELDEYDLLNIFTYRTTNPDLALRMYEIAMQNEDSILDIDMDILNEIKLDFPQNRSIISSHFQNPMEFRDRFSALNEYKFSAIKLASFFDELTLLDIAWFLKHSNSGRILSIVPQGQDNQPMRIASAILASDFMYSSLGKAVVDGQYKAEILNEIMNLIYGSADGK